MSLDPREMESKAQMLVNEPGYDIPEDIRGIPRARIQGRADVIVRQNDAIARLNPPAPRPTPEPEPATQEPSTSGGKKRKSKRNKKSKKNKSKRIKRKTRR
jgi:hypothetical protein